jgi:chromosomal replication initiation ATPase DnaA
MIYTNKVKAMQTVINKAAAKVSAIMGEPIELQIRKVSIEDYQMPETAKQVNREILKTLVVQMVCDQYMISKGDLVSKIRITEFVDARKTAAHLIDNFISAVPHVQIAEILKMDRTTVIYNIRKADDLLLTDKAFRYNYEQISTRLKSVLNDGKAQN